MSGYGKAGEVTFATSITLPCQHKGTISENGMK